MSKRFDVARKRVDRARIIQYALLGLGSPHPIKMSYISGWVHENTDLPHPPYRVSELEKVADRLENRIEPFVASNPSTIQFIDNSIEIDNRYDDEQKELLPLALILNYWDYATSKTIHPREAVNEAICLVSKASKVLPLYLFVCERCGLIRRTVRG